MVKLTALLLAVFAVAVRRANAETDAEIKIDAGMSGFIQTCLKEMNINVNEPVKVSYKTDIIETFDPCFFECMWKKMGAMNDQRSFDLTNFGEAVGKFLNRPGDAEKTAIMGKACAPDKPYTKCEQSKDLLYCLIEHKEKVNL